MPDELVSIVVPAYRADRFIEATLRTVEAQTHKRWELLVTEDASDGTTQQTVQEFSHRHPQNRVVYNRHQQNQGPSATRNTSLALAEGRYVALLDADDLWEPHHLAASIRAMEQTGSKVVYSTALMFDDDTGHLVGLWGPTETEQRTFPAGLCSRSFIVPSTVVMERAVLDRVGPFDVDPAIQGCEDIDFWLRCVRAGVAFHCQPGLHCRYRKGHAEAATTRMKHILPRQVKVLEKHFGMIEISRHEQRQALAQYRYLTGRFNLDRPAFAAGMMLSAWCLQPARPGFLAGTAFACACAVLHPIAAPVKSWLGSNRGSLP